MANERPIIHITTELAPVPQGEVSPCNLSYQPRTYLQLNSLLGDVPPPNTPRYGPSYM
jgi:hypothetical protein